MCRFIRAGFGAADRFRGFGIGDLAADPAGRQSAGRRRQQHRAEAEHAGDGDGAGERAHAGLPWPSSPDPAASGSVRFLSPLDTCGAQEAFAV